MPRPPAAAAIAASTFTTRASLGFLACVLVSFLAASAVPTPLYQLYQAAWQFSPVMLTGVFGIYAFSLLAALLTVGSLSDYLGRRPLIAAALLLEAAAMLLFLFASDVNWLLAARAVQGFATGIATSVLGAALQDHDREQGPLINSLSPLLGMAVGALGAAVMVQWAPQPLHLVYGVALLVFAVLGGLLRWLPESVTPQPGAWASLRPQLSVPPQARRALLQVLPVNTAVWSVGGFFLSLVPSLVRHVTGETSSLLGGGLVATLTLSGALSILTVRHWPARRILLSGTLLLMAGVALVLLAANQAGVALFFVAALVIGSGFGAGFLGAVRSVVPLAHAHERAGLMAAFFVLSYLAFSVPAICAGFMIQRLGLVPTTDGYGAVQAALCVIALALMWRKPAAGG